MKKCYLCKKEKELDAFSSDKSKKDNKCNRCKDCSSSYHNNHRLKNLSLYRERDKKYNVTHKKQRNKYNNDWKKKNTHKNAAHSLIYLAIKQGVLKKEKCRDCERIETEAHHNDYTKPLEVIWLCRFHHRLEKHKSQDNT